jgi:hypothetical protein
MSVNSGAKRKEGGAGEFIRLLIHAGIIARENEAPFSFLAWFPAPSRAWAAGPAFG